MKKTLKAFLGKFYTKKSAKSAAGEIQQTIEASKNDFDYLSPQFLIFGITPIAAKIITNVFNLKNSETAIVNILAIGIFIFQFCYFLTERAKLKRNGTVYNFHLYDAWGCVWFLFGSVSTLVVNVFEILYSYELIIPRVYLAALIIWEIIGIALVLIMVLFTGISLKNTIMKVASVWLVTLIPIIFCVDIKTEYLQSALEENRIAIYGDMLNSISEVKILIYIVYIVIGIYYISNRKVINNGVN